MKKFCRTMLAICVLFVPGCAFSVGSGGVGGTGFVFSTETKIGMYHDQSEDGRDAQSSIEGSVSIDFPDLPFSIDSVPTEID